MGNTKNRIPEDIRKKIERKLGKMSDKQLAEKFSKEYGLQIDRHTIFWMRSQKGIPPVKAKPYTKPPFRGRLEVAHPEVKELIGKMPLTVIGEHYEVSRSCVRAAAKRLGIKDPGVIQFDRQLQEQLRAAKDKQRDKARQGSAKTGQRKAEMDSPTAQAA